VLDAIAKQSSASHFPADEQFGNVRNAVPFKRRYDLQRHFERHGEEFEAENADAYERLADAFKTGPLRDGALECTRGDGALVCFDPRTDELGVLTSVGHIATFMILRTLPSGRQTALEYIRSNCK